MTVGFFLHADAASARITAAREAKKYGTHEIDERLTQRALTVSNTGT